MCVCVCVCEVTCCIIGEVCVRWCACVSVQSGCVYAMPGGTGSGSYWGKMGDLDTSANTNTVLMEAVDEAPLCAQQHPIV